MMHTEQIRQLLERYWEGETSLEEERSLKKYFNGENVDPQFSDVAPLFRAIKSEQSVNWNRKLSIRPVSTGPFRWAAAAAILVLLGAGIWWRSRSLPTPGEAEMALSVRKAARTPAAPLPQIIPEKPARAVASVAVARRGKVRRTARQPDAQRAVPETNTETAKKEILEAFSLLSSKLKKGRKEAGKGLQEMECMDIIKRKPAEG